MIFDTFFKKFFGFWWQRLVRIRWMSWVLWPRNLERQRKKKYENYDKPTSLNRENSKRRKKDNGVHKKKTMNWRRNDARWREASSYANKSKPILRFRKLSFFRAQLCCSLDSRFSFLLFVYIHVCMDVCNINHFNHRENFCHQILEILNNISLRLHHRHIGCRSLSFILLLYIILRAQFSDTVCKRSKYE